MGGSDIDNKCSINFNADDEKLHIIIEANIT